MSSTHAPTSKLEVRGGRRFRSIVGLEGPDLTRQGPVVIAAI